MDNVTHIVKVGRKQNKLTLSNGEKVRFVEVSRPRRCFNCALRKHNYACWTAPCASTERNDERNGYFELVPAEPPQEDPDAL